MRNSLDAQLTKHLMDAKQWVSKGTLTADKVWKHQSGKSAGARYLPETVGRALRSLEESSVIAVKEDGISVQYKWIPIDMRNKYIPFTQRPKYSKAVLFKK